MGSTSSIFLRNDPSICWIDEIRPTDPLIKGFAKQIFKRFEWATLKIFCNAHNIKHVDVAIVFKRMLSYEEVYIVQFKARASDVKAHYAMQSRLMQVGTLYFGLFKSNYSQYNS